MTDWTPPRCIHGCIILGCPYDDCPTQTAYLDQQDAAIRAWHRRQQEQRDKVRSRLETMPVEDTPRQTRQSEEV